MKESWGQVDRSAFAGSLLELECTVQELHCVAETMAEELSASIRHKSLVVWRNSREYLQIITTKANDA